MADLKTKKNDASVKAFLEGIEDDRRRQEGFAMLQLMEEATGEQATMWGSNIVGFGSYRYKYASGREGEWFLAGFSPRKQNLTLYIMSGFDGYDALLEELGKHKTGKSCLYINKLGEVDLEILRDLVVRSVNLMRAAHP
jgi:hypothetical protein